MTSKITDLTREYEKNNQLKKVDVDLLEEWAQKQAHLPYLTEFQLILFLQSCYFDTTKAKSAIEHFFKLKIDCPSVFTERTLDKIRKSLDVLLVTPLKKTTSKGNQIIFIKFMDCDSKKFNMAEQMKIIDMCIMLMLMQQGTAQGHAIVVDVQGLTLGHVMKLRPVIFRHFFTYLQEGLPMRLKEFHFFNIVPLMGMVMNFCKNFMKAELYEMLQIHSGPLENIFKDVPKECFPRDYGGDADTIEHLHEQEITNISENIVSFKEW